MKYCNCGNILEYSIEYFVDHGTLSRYCDSCGYYAILHLGTDMETQEYLRQLWSLNTKDK